MSETGQPERHSNHQFNQLSDSQIYYLREVLGVEQILWKRPDLTVEPLRPEREVVPSTQSSSVQVIVEQLDAGGRDLLLKMLQAMKLADYKILENPNSEIFSQALHQRPPMVLIFGQAGAEACQLDFARRGQILKDQGVPVLITYGPRELSRQVELKAQAWKDMKLAIETLAEVSK